MFVWNKAYSKSLSSDESVSFSMLGQKVNAPFPVQFDLISTLVSFSQFLKAYSPIDKMDAGIVTDVISAQFAKTSSSMIVTGTPLIFSGITRSPLRSFV